MNRYVQEQQQVQKKKKEKSLHAVDCLYINITSVVSCFSPQTFIRAVLMKLCEMKPCVTATPYHCNCTSVQMQINQRNNNDWEEQYSLGIGFQHGG